MTRKIDPSGRIAVYAEAYGITRALDMHAEKRRKNLLVLNGGQRIEIKSNLGDNNFQQVDFGTWVSACSKVYNISPDIMDYVFVPVMTMPSDLPNRNGVGFPLKELTAFSVDEGRLGYQTFKGKRVHIEHKNDVPEESIGAIVDVSLRPLKNYGNGKAWKLLELLAIDRSKDPTYARKVLEGEINTYSMGAWVESYTCSVCGKEMGERNHCTHLHPKEPIDFYELGGQLVFRQVRGIKGFETSIVDTPAYVSAISDNLMTLRS